VYNLSGLTKLSFTVIVTWSDSAGADRHQGLTRLLKRCHNLAHLHLSLQTQLDTSTDVRAYIFGQLDEDTIPCTRLRSLHLSCFGASEEAIRRVVLANPSLERLALIGTKIFLSSVPPGAFPALRVWLAPTLHMVEELSRIGAPELQEIRQMGPIGEFPLRYLVALARRAPRLAVLGWDDLRDASSQDQARELSCMLPDVSIVDEHGACFKFEGTVLERVQMRLHYAVKNASDVRSQKESLEGPLRSLRARGIPVNPDRAKLVAQMNTDLQSLELTVSTLRNEEEMLTRAMSNDTD
jgi:hypothetical protein